MFILILLLVMSVFLGTEIFAIHTPVLQLSLYRLLMVLAWLMTFYQLSKRSPRLTLGKDLLSHYIIGVFGFWWVWALVSLTWSFSISHWFRAFFLLSMGVSAIIMIYFWTGNLRQWKVLIQGMWVAMTGLMVWGYYEIITNHYILADLTKLDKYDTFATQPFSRIPITIFENQNDYATLLLAYLVVSIIHLHLSTSQKGKLLILGTVFMTSYLIIRSDSRMILLSFITFFLILVLLNIRLDFSFSIWIKGITGVVAIVVLMAIFIEPVSAKLADLFYTGFGQALNGDSVRLNLWRNGLHFLGQTWGMGVGAGNIEFWMAYFSQLPTRIITNMHNWWLEILVAYGLPVFIAYVSAYVAMIYLLLVRRNQLPPPYCQVNNILIAFLIVYIFASITSASNMLIEWHWVFFGVLIAYLKLIEQMRKADSKVREKYEFIYHH